MTLILFEMRSASAERCHRATGYAQIPYVPRSLQQQEEVLCALQTMIHSPNS